MEVAKKHLLMLIMVCVVATILSLAVFQVCQDHEEPSPIVIFSDESLNCAIGSFNEPGLFSNVTLGWCNQSFWIRNNVEYPVEIDVYYVLPQGWSLGWDYDGSPIEPAEVRKIKIGVFVPYIPAADKMMLAVNLKYRVIDGE